MLEAVDDVLDLLVVFGVLYARARGGRMPCVGGLGVSDWACCVLP